MKKKVLVVGGGGREHTLVWKLAQSPRVGKIFIAPGNPGTSQWGENVDIATSNIPALVAFARKEKVDLTVVGPDDPLAAGIVDIFQKEKLLVFGPSQRAAQVEWSKAFSKQFMEKYKLPTAEFQTFTDYEQALEYIHQKAVPIVIKASGLALGKGVFICHTKTEAQNALKDLLVQKTLGEAGAQVVIEEYLDGPEISAHIVSDGDHHIVFPFAQDHKRIGDGNTGPNTGGMGSYAPLSWVSKGESHLISKEVIEPTMRALREEIGCFQGCLFPGLMMIASGPKLLEFNARFGDPETQSYMRLLESDLYEMLEGAAKGALADVTPIWSEQHAVCVVLTSAGYPGVYEKGKVISGLEGAEKIPGVVVFHAGTAVSGGALVTSGGRVLGVSAVAGTLQEAVDKAYQAVGKIHFDGMYYRRDIAYQGLASKS
ncbi:MAG TPA: phosphoribosylamine--glycine ligase [Verrucomicrobiae bacterium]|nr:phosphoribosylamine--glycine ligase [Verrucomicrobiae bacterium]